jgi:hypothetical protein
LLRRVSDYQHLLQGEMHRRGAIDRRSRVGT